MRLSGPLKCFFAFLFAFAASAADDLFATNAPVPRIKIEISKEGIRSLERESRKPVMATVIEGNTTYSNVLIHAKGAAGSTRSIHDNPGLTLNFSKTNENQRFHGLRKIHLNNSVQDPSYTTHNLCSQIFNAAGVPAARISSARVWLNGRDLGFYVLAEGYTKDFLKRYFETTDGNLYDGGFLQDITDHLENDAGDERTDRSDLKALAAAAMFPDRAQRWSQLQKVLDVDRFLTFMALEVMMWDWDGYIMKHNNYRIYTDTKSKKMTFIPHGMDQMFWDAYGPIFRPPADGLVARAILDSPEGSKAYRERLKETFAKRFRLEDLTNRFEQIARRNRTVMEEMGRGAVNHHDGQIREVRQRIAARWRGVKDQIDNEPKPMDLAKPAVVRQWRPQNEMGNARFEEPSVDGLKTYYIAVAGQTSASWRSSVSLEPGTYRFHGMARTSKLAPVRDQKGEGAGLRISGTTQPRRNKVETDGQWTRLQFDFEVAGGGSEITLVAEVRASKGEVWFDANSLKLEKLK